MSQPPIIQNVRKSNYVVAVDPYKVRWGFNPVVRDKYLEGRECGISILPYAQFFAIQSYETIKEFHTTDDTQPKENKVVVPAAEAEKYFIENFAGKNTQINVPDWGLRIGFVAEEDEAKMKVISRVLLPDLPTIRTICANLNIENPIGSFCEGQDDLNFDERQTCPTCWMRWLISDSLPAYVSKIAKEGMKVIEIDENDKRTERTVKPSIAEFETARDLMIQSFQVGLATLEETWNGIVSEVDEKVRKTIPQYQHNFRRDLHAAKPADRGIQVVQEYAKANAANSNNGKLEDVMAMMAAAQVQTNQLLEQVLKEKK